MHDKSPQYDSNLAEVVRDILNTDDHRVIGRIVQEASTSLSDKLKGPDQIILYSMIYTSDRLGLSPLHISNIYHFMISPIGEIKRIRTKAWDKSRRKVAVIREMLIEEVKVIAHRYAQELLSI